MKIIRWIGLFFSFYLIINLSIASYSKYNSHLKQGDFFVSSGELWPIHLAFFIIIFFITHYEISNRIIPDKFTLPGIIIGLLLSYVFDINNFWDHVLGVFVGGGIFYGLAASYFLSTRREGIGGGVIKLASMIGAFLGTFNVIIAIFLSCIFGTIYGLIIFKKDNSPLFFEFGPILSIFSLTTVVFSYEKLLYALTQIL